MYEGFYYPAIEASATGTPIVGSYNIPSEVLIHGYNGFRINIFDERTYASYIIKLLKDEELWSRMSRNAREHAKKFDAVVIAQRILDIYKCTKS